MIIVRMVFFLAFFLMGTIFLSKAEAQYTFYGANVSIDDTGKSNISMVINFREPTRTFRFTVFGRTENFYYGNNLGIIGCAVTTVQTSVINCNFAQGVSSLYLHFETNDFVQSMNGTNIFNADF